MKVTENADFFFTCFSALFTDGAAVFSDCLFRTPAEQSTFVPILYNQLIHE
ncbi:hypothetical protein [Taibaiella soli]|uniref:hypothetical protein n=1 Tax=Taibaiella soli TaxID=1649169 RepID=UPI0014034498|nr:hypothetical protein [Taibaiella soli]